MLVAVYSKNVMSKTPYRVLFYYYLQEKVASFSNGIKVLGLFSSVWFTV